jgi:hypothetical protein
VRSGLIDGVVVMVVAGAREDLVVGAAHGGMDQVVVEWAVGVDVTELFTFYDLLSVGLAFLLFLSIHKGNLYILQLLLFCRHSEREMRAPNHKLGVHQDRSSFRSFTTSTSCLS